MLSDDSSSESESGRFKTHNKSERKITKNDGSFPPKRGELLPDLGRHRNSDRPFGREFDRRHDRRGRFDRRRSRDRYDSSRRHSPSRRRHSRERSPEQRRSPDRHRQARDGGEYSRSTCRDKRVGRENKGEDNRSNVIDHKNTDERSSTTVEVKRKHSPITLAPETKRNLREEIQKNVIANFSKAKSPESERGLKDRVAHCSRKNNHPSPKHRKSEEKLLKMSVVHRPTDTKPTKRQSHSPPKEKTVNVEKEIKRSKGRKYLEQDDTSDCEQPASYYNLVPATVEITNAPESIQSITDSDDEERLRAKLLNLEKELDKTKKKRVKKSKKKSKSRHKDKDDPVEVSSTTDIQGKLSYHDKESLAAEVSSTQHKSTKESSEEGEITTDDDSLNRSMDASDLRHRLKRIPVVPDTSGSPDLRQKLNSMADISGPALPPHMEKISKKSVSPDIEGPVLPPHLRRDRSTIGPTLPTEMRKVLAETSLEHSVNLESSEDEGIGPLPAGAEEKWTAAHKKLEERALDIKIRSLEGSSRSEAKSREEWMLELPEGKAKYLGLGPRQFRSKEGPDMSDRSSWTDTPQQKALKEAGLAPVEEASSEALQREAHERYIAERDHQHEKAVKKHKKKHKRDESLLDMHQKKLKKKKKKEDKEGPKVRRPFDRDVDLQANRFDDAQKKAIIRKAQQLDSRFSSGDAKYL